MNRSVCCVSLFLKSISTTVHGPIIFKVQNERSNARLDLKKPALSRGELIKSSNNFKLVQSRSFVFSLQNRFAVSNIISIIK